MQICKYGNKERADTTWILPEDMALEPFQLHISPHRGALCMEELSRITDIKIRILFGTVYSEEQHATLF